MSKTSAFGGWISTLVAAFSAVGLLFFIAFASSVGATPNVNKGSAGMQAAPCTGEVVLDPGHGGTDFGAVNNAYGLKEKEQNLVVANLLKTKLEQDGRTVCMTRTDNDTTLSNADRYAFANQTGAKVLVSIHMNASSKDPSLNYTTTLFGKWQKDKKFAYSVFNKLKELPAASDPNAYHRYPCVAASTEPCISSRSPYSYASGVLLKSTMPATIAETVFITNRDEARLLSDSGGWRQQQIAEALRRGIYDYLGWRPASSYS